jgi:hypothetical protein
MGAHLSSGQLKDPLRTAIHAPVPDAQRPCVTQLPRLVKAKQAALGSAASGVLDCVPLRM